MRRRGGDRSDDRAAYEDLNLTNSGPAIERCQRAIGKKVSLFFNGVTKAMNRCEDGVLKGPLSGTCPQASGSVVAKIDRLIQNLRGGICMACGGVDQVCGGPARPWPRSAFPRNVPP
ncbi:MAG: hypothetical protein ABIR79_04235 [Candidatus Binatia bacterium]